MDVDVDRAAGALLGLAAGDALGAPYEFEPPVAAEDAAMVGGGIAGWAPGEWTDDTQMAVCIAQVTATGSRDVAAIGDAFCDWYASHPPDVGNQTRAVLAGARAGDELPARAAAHCKANPHGAAGNGSLMRTAPVALACLGDDDALAEMAREVSALTHGDRLAGEACVLWCVAVDRAVREARLDGIGDGLARIDDPARREQWRALIADAERQPPSAFRPNGFVVTALQAAHAAIHHTPIPSDQPGRHLEDALRRAVSIGDDTDTVAAIAGALLGARWGRSAIPLAWQRLMHGWPGLRARDLTTLAVRTVGATADDAGWPTTPSLLAYYRHVDPGDPVVCPAPGDSRLLLGNVHGLTEADADAVVSLCRIGPDDVPTGVEHIEVHLIDQADKNPNLRLVLDHAAATIHALRREGKRVFLHCAGGRSRTPTVAAWYLAGRTGRAATDLIDELAGVLPRVAINPEFMQLLASTTPTWSSKDDR